MVLCSGRTSETHHQLPAMTGFHRKRANQGTTYQPRPRLRWTQELHDRFLMAVNQLGGANKATPKGIRSLMSVDGLTLYHLKSHLQKFRLGKTAKRLLRRDFTPADYRCKNDERLAPVNMKEQGSSITSNVFDSNGNMALGAYGNLHLLVEKTQTAMRNMGIAKKSSSLNINSQAAITVVKVEKEEVVFVTAKPPLLPLFPACGLEWPNGGDIKPVAPCPNDNRSVFDYLDTLGCYSSADFGMTKTHQPSRPNAIYGSFFDEVASFANVDLDDLTMDDLSGVVSAGFSNDYP